jgi:hypothetical protein
MKSLMIWEGCPFKQYLPLKASESGIKIYELCVATTGYLWSFLIYAGKDKVHFHLLIADTNKVTAIVLELVEPLYCNRARLCGWITSVTHLV